MDFQTKLENLAELAVRIGTNVQVGQRLNIYAALETVDLVRLITRKAYQAGAAQVVVFWADEQIALERILHSQEEFLTHVSEEAHRNYEEFTTRGDARLRIRTSNPALFAQADAKRMQTVAHAISTRHKQSADKFHSSMVNWSIVPFAVPSWAEVVFTKEAPEVALEKLWEAVFMATRADQPDPVAAWQQHLTGLETRRDFLNHQKLQALEFKSPDTDLRIELPLLHRWEGGSAQTNNPNHGQSIGYVPNLPTEEVFTAPHRLGVNGTVKASKPLFAQGKMIEGICMTFKDGKVMTATATKNELTLHQILELDEGAKHLGEVALVAESSPVAQSGLLFQETLFDENAACHIAMGNAYSYTIQGGNQMSQAELLAAGANDSALHMDWMIGSRQMDVTGIRADDSKLELLCAGEWAFKP